MLVMLSKALSDWAHNLLKQIIICDGLSLIAEVVQGYGSDSVMLQLFLSFSTSPT